MKKEKTEGMRRAFLVLWLIFTLLTFVSSMLYIFQIVDRVAYVLAPLAVSFLFYFGYKH